MMKLKNNFLCWLPKECYSFTKLEKLIGKKLLYASMGRNGIYHILKAIEQNIEIENKKVMMPVYACRSIVWGIEKAGYTPVYYDICLEDLNANINSIKKIFLETKSKILLLPSLYGNPANLLEIENYCKKNNIFLIDDAAQAFGSQLEGKYIGTYGNSGLFSFSAGKPTFGHMGCFFWTELPYEFKKKKNFLYHKIAYFNYFYNRYGDYNSKKLYRSKIFNYFNIFLYKILDLKNSNICDFEKTLLVKIAIENTKKNCFGREDVVKKVNNILKKSNHKIRLITALRGIPNNNKLVIISETEAINLKLKKFLIENNIYCSFGYDLLDFSEKKYPIATSIYKRILEIPITNDEVLNHKIILCLKNLNF